MGLTNSDRLEMDRIFLKIEDRILEFDEAITELRESHAAVLAAMDEERQRTGTEGTGRRRT